MKRKNYGDDGGSQKRHRSGGDHHGRSNNDSNNANLTPLGTSSGNSPQKHNGTSMESTAPRQPPVKAQKHSDSPKPADPLLQLEATLKAITDHPEALEAMCGSEAASSAQVLFKAISKRKLSSTASLDLIHPSTKQLQTIAPYYVGEHIRDYSLPPLPQVPEGPYSTVPFSHKSRLDNTAVHDASSLTYERLEFLGDAYIEIIATRILFARYPHFTAGKQAQAREQLVKNETLLGFSRAYDFHKRLDAVGVQADTSTKANKGYQKVLADVFEAYVAAVVLSDPETGFTRVEKWLTELWAPILLKSYGPESERALEAAYDARAKEELQKRVYHRDVKIEYLEERPMEQSKHVQKYFIGVYLTGWGYKKEFLGKATGQSKVEAGNRAAMDAMANSEACSDATRQLAELREARRKAKEAEAGTE